ncbi:MAG: hypothetical protein GXP48_02480 [Acidobacteria bacterium]|nr:hypothetical protein [Acidobacteriota bacterium]
MHGNRNVDGSTMSAADRAGVFPRGVLLVVACLALVLRPGFGDEPGDGPALHVHGVVVMDLLRNRNVDDTFAHYAARTGAASRSTGGQSWLELSGVLGRPRGIRLSYCASADFMGKHGSEIVSAWIRARHGRWSLLAGKAESLLATNETTLNHDGFYSSGGIQTGIHANLDELRLGFDASSSVTLFALLTNEPASNGGPDGQVFHSRRPAFQAALQYHSGCLSAKLAGHLGAMRLGDGRHFDPRALMTEVKVALGRSLTWTFTTFRACAGSELFTTDILVDYVSLPGGGIRETATAGGLSQLIFESPHWDAWAGFGLFTVSERSRRRLATVEPEDALLDNRRCSLGGRWHITPTLHAALELSRYSTRHLRGRQIDHVSGTVVQLQLAVTF